MIYKIIVDKQPMSNPSQEKREYTIDIEELHFKRDVYDSLVITLDEDYVMRRLELGEYNVLTELDPPRKEPLQDINIQLFEGDNYIYLYDMAGNKIVAQYLIKNEFNELYVLHTEMNSAIEQTANAIELSVNGKIARVDGDIDDLSASLELKVDKNDNDQVVSMINASADEITLNSNRLIINSTNFKLNSAGNISATGGDIAGFNFSSTKFSKALSGIYKYNEYDLVNAICSVVDIITLSSVMKDIYDVNGDGVVNQIDVSKMIRQINGTEAYSKTVNGTFEINANDPKRCIRILKDNEEAVCIGTGGLEAKTIVVDNIISGYVINAKVNGVIIDGKTQTIIVQDNSNSTTIRPSGITTPTLTQTSKEEEKKDFEELENGLDIVTNTDIYKYHLKSQEDNDKKHIGFVIGNNYKYRKEITSKDNDGVDLYSMVAVAYKAIQEQQEQIEKLQKQNAQKDEILANLITRLEKLEKEENNNA